MDEFEASQTHNQELSLGIQSECLKCSDSKDDLGRQTKRIEVYLQLERVICSDNKDEFATFLKNQKIEPGTEVSKTELFKLLCLHRAIGCAGALLNGETGLTVDLNFRLEEGLTPLAIAAQSLCYGLTELFLTHGADPSLGGDHVGGDISSLPLTVALDALCNHQLLRNFPAGPEYIYDLFWLFWLPELKEPLDTIKLLAARTKQVEMVGVSSVGEWNLVKLAALLMVAWDKFVINNDIESSPIRQLIRKQLALGLYPVKTEIPAASMYKALLILKMSDNFVEEYRTTSMVKNEVVPLDVAYQFLTNVKLRDKPMKKFQLCTLAAVLQLGEIVLLVTHLTKKSSISMITEPIRFYPRSSQETNVGEAFTFDDRITCAMLLDDRDEFVKLMNQVGSFGSLDCEDNLVEIVRQNMFQFDSANCAAAVLAGETDDFISFSDLTDVGWSFLHNAAKLACPKLTALFLENGFLADDRRDSDELNFKAALPLNVALESIRDNYAFQDWKHYKSVTDLVILLSDNGMRNTLETVRLLVLKTSNVYFEFLRYLKEGKMVELGALLMVGCKEFLPSGFVVNSMVSSSFTHNAGAADPMRHFSTTFEHVNFPEDHDPLEMKGTLLLIDIFEKIGYYLGAYIRLDKWKHCCSEVSWLILTAISDTPISQVIDTSSRGYFANHKRVLGREYHNFAEQLPHHKLLSRNIFSKQDASCMLSKQGTSVTFARSLHTSVLKNNADHASFVPAERLIHVLRQLHAPMRCVPIVAALKRGLRGL